MKKTFTALALAAQLLTQNPEIASSETMNITDTTKSNIVSVFENEKEQNLSNSDSPSILSIEAMFIDGKFQREIHREFRSGKKGFIETLYLVTDPEDSKSNFFDEVLQQVKKTRHPRDKVEKAIVNKFGEDAYHKVSKYFFHATISLALEMKGYNLLAYDKQEDFYKFDKETISVFESVGIQMPDNIGEYDNFSFKGSYKDGISIVTLKDNKVIEFAKISGEEIKSNHQEVFNMIIEAVKLLKNS